MNNENKPYDLLMESYLWLAESDRKFFGRYNLSQVRYFALKHIFQKPAISITELSKYLLCTKGNTTRIIKGMINDGLVTVIKDTEDQRALHIHLTKNGESLLSRVQKDFTSFNQIRLNACLHNRDCFELTIQQLREDLEKSIQELDIS